MCKKSDPILPPERPALQQHNSLVSIHQSVTFVAPQRMAICAANQKKEKKPPVTKRKDPQLRAHLRASGGASPDGTYAREIVSFWHFDETACSRFNGELIYRFVRLNPRRTPQRLTRRLLERW
jgi:hypothetical protein